MLKSGKLSTFLLLIPFIFTPFVISSDLTDSSLFPKHIFIIISFFFISIYLSLRNNYLYDKNIFIYMIIFFGYCLSTSYIHSFNFNKSIWDIVFQLSWFFILITFINILNKELITCILISTSLVSGLLSLICINDLLNIFSLDIPSKGLMSATFGYRNYFSQYLCFSIPAGLISIMIISNKKVRYLLLLCTSLSLVSLFLTRTRAAWIAIFVIFIIFIYINRNFLFNAIKTNIKNKCSILFISAFIFVFSFILSIPITGSTTSTDTMDVNKTTISQTLSTLFNFDKSSFGDRYNMYKSTGKMINDHFLFGVGVGNWYINYPFYSRNNQTDIDDKVWKYDKIIKRPHNDFLLIFSEIGSVGLLLILIPMLYYLRYIFKSLINKDEYFYINQFCLLALICIFIESMFDFPKERIMPNLYFFFIIAIIHQQIYKSKIKETNFVLPLLSTFVFLSFLLFKINDINNDKDFAVLKQLNKDKRFSESTILAEKVLKFRNVDYSGTPIYYYLGISAYNNKELDKANNYFNKGLSLFPYHLGLLGNSLIINGKTEDIDKAYDKMLLIKSLYPKLIKPQIDMAKIYINQNNMKKARRVLLDINYENDEILSLLLSTK